MQNEFSAARFGRMRGASDTADRIRGCLFGGAVGDALGYPAEFLSYEQIRERFGKDGITSYSLSSSGLAVISDDTQMTLFTAVGLLAGKTLRLAGIFRQKPRYFAALSYRDWLVTQVQPFESGKGYHRGFSGGSVSWLRDVRELYRSRAPGNTCISSLTALKHREPPDDFIAFTKNDSKGCGGVMRIAPLALDHDTARFCGNIEKLDYESAQIAAVTHGHPHGYISAAVLCHILRRIVFASRPTLLSSIIAEAMNTVRGIFPSAPEVGELFRLIDRAAVLAKNNRPDEENIRSLGQGWVAEETLAIALYCTLRYSDNFSAGVLAAVNHDGDSDSTGAVTGNLLGALCGYSRIGSEFKKNLELSDVILEIADDLHRSCINEESCLSDPKWVEKYLEMRREKPPCPTDSSIFIGAQIGNISDTDGYDAVMHSEVLTFSGMKKETDPSELTVGSARIVYTEDLPCRFVIKTVGPKWQDGKHGEGEYLASCYRTALILAAEHGARSIAFLPVSVGVHDFPTEFGAKIAVRTVVEFVLKNPGVFGKIGWIVKNEQELEICRAQIERYDMDRLTETVDF